MLNSRPTVRSTLKALLYIAPLLVISLAFTFWPLLEAFAMGFYRHYNFYLNQIGSLSLANFQFLWHDAAFHLALRNTLIFIIGVVPVSIGLALLLALSLHHARHFAKLLQTIYFLPLVTSSVAIAIVWRWLFSAEHGGLNSWLAVINRTPVDWLNDPRYSLLALIIVCIWHSLGLNIILLLASLQQIDRRYYLAAQLDGASSWQQFTNVTWPLLTPMILLVSINAVIVNLKVFDQVYALFNGSAGPANADLTLMYYLYQKFYVEDQPTIAAACGIVLFGITVGLTLGTLWVLRRHHYPQRGWSPS